MTQSILQQQSISQEILSSEESGIAGTLVILTSLDSSLDNSLSFVIIGGSGSDSNLSLNSIQLSIIVDRTNILLVDLVVTRGQTTITNQNGASNFLIQHHPHLRLQPSHNIEISDIDHVVTIQLLLLVNRSRSSGTLQQAEHFLLLQFTLHVTPSTSLVLSNICKHRLNTRERGMMNAIHNSIHPTHVALNELRRVIQALSLREQVIDVVDAIVASMSQERLLQTTIALTIIENSLHSVMAKGVLLLGVLVKYIVFHIRFLLISFVGATLGFKGLPNHCINYILLFFSQSVEHFTNGLFLSGLFSHFRFLLFLFWFIGMREFEFFSGINNRFLIRLFTMHDDRINVGPRVCSCKNQTNFTDVSMQNIVHILLKLVRINRKSIYVTMLNEQLCSIACVGVIKFAVSVNALVTILEHGMPKNFVNIVVLVIPNKRNFLTIIRLKCIFHDYSTVRAFKIISSRPATKIIIHFESVLLHQIFRSH